MHTIQRGILGALGALSLVGPALAQPGPPGPPPPPGTALYARLTGAAERPGPGDGNVTGSFTAVVAPDRTRLCYMFFNVALIDPPTAAHIHVGGPEEAGRPVVTLEPPADGTGGGCVPVAADLALELTSNPAGYYVNVHNRTLPNGAVRGQLAG